MRQRHAEGATRRYGDTAMRRGGDGGDGALERRSGGSFLAAKPRFKIA
jgi:hypothetical protein